jgi:hypothetical protein
VSPAAGRIAVRAARAVYGSIIALAVIVVLDDGHSEADEVIIAVIGATVGAMLAETYADYIADVIRRGRHLHLREARQAFTDSVLGMLAAWLTLLPFVAVEVGVIETSTAFSLATWFGLGVIGLYTLVANHRAGIPFGTSLWVTGLMLALGLALIAVKSTTH